MLLTVVRAGSSLPFCIIKSFCTALAILMPLWMPCQNLSPPRPYVLGGLCQMHISWTLQLLQSFLLLSLSSQQLHTHSTHTTEIPLVNNTPQTLIYRESSCPVSTILTLGSNVIEQKDHLPQQGQRYQGITFTAIFARSFSVRPMHIVSQGEEWICRAELM